MLRKVIANVLMITFMFTLIQPVSAATSPLLEQLAEVERVLYGVEKPGAVLRRIKDIETELGKPAAETDTVFVRVENLANFVSRGPSSLVMKMNAIEWGIFQTQSNRAPLRTRLDQFEEKFSGEIRSSVSITQRIEDLVAMIYPGSKLNTVPVTLSPGTKVRVRLLTELNSNSSKEGSTISYQAVSDIKIDGNTAIPIGAEGVGVIKAVKRPGAFGQAGQITVDFGQLPAFDGTPVALTAPNVSTQSQQELAAGASIGGMVLLGPLGLAAGYLVKGKDETIPAGTEIVLEVKNEVQVQALSLTPAK